MKLILKNKNKKIDLNVKKCGIFRKFCGLMFLSKEKSEALLFNFKKPKKIKIHSLFVFFPFVILWLDKDNKIINSKIVKPFEVSIGIKKNFSKIIEIPINKRYKKLLMFLQFPVGRKI